jgi:hypothetical protein
MRLYHFLKTRHAIDDVGFWASVLVASNRSSPIPTPG